eukprot:CAMPEP_0178526878 /NCGR_PEP_ID=MMETSP0696-20121128/30965_1 /TAXON_ID=265572 /ORGANISM="Extubocellulus spinifer, Strain CCMP396" /LENGTH=378 /DNA_ID=CAMNT_0020158417 /DNA_START=113 /DNA_END=1250 /DNA_ORIENTATION=+
MSDVEAETKMTEETPQDPPKTDGDAMDEEADNGDRKESSVVGSAALRPVFLGNLNHTAVVEDIEKIFTEPITGEGVPPVPVDRVDLKRGFCFVFLKDAESQEAKERAENYVSTINGMEVPSVSTALRSEFARGDGRTKRKEDERRKNIQPSETLFVVNFHEETTKREDLQMLFEPFGQLVRIDMKRNYAFVQYTTTDEAKQAKEATNGGKLDQSVITVEYVARRMGEGGGGRGRDRGRRDRGYGGGGYRDGRRGGGGGYRDDRYDDRRGGGGRDRYDDRRRDDDRDRGGRYRDDRNEDRRGGGYGPAPAAPDTVAAGPALAPAAPLAIVTDRAAPLLEEEGTDIMMIVAGITTIPVAAATVVTVAIADILIVADMIEQ